MKKSNAERLMELFSGSTKAHGHYQEPTRETRPTGTKWGIGSSATVVHHPPTLEQFEQHIAGTYPLGIIPINERNCCTWGSIDVDDYNINPIDVVNRIEGKNYPLIPVFSKSGGLHLFLFLTTEQPCVLVRSVLNHFASKLGLANCEVFPKQNELAGEKDIGNWLALPYLGTTYEGKLAEQTGLKKTGARSTIEEFLSLAEATRISEEQLHELDSEQLQKPKAHSTSSDTSESFTPFSDGPPCLQHLADQRVFDGQGRNSTLFMMALYYIRKDESSWKQQLELANRTYFNPPLDSGEVQNIIKSVEKKGARDPEEGYRYTCKTAPMSHHCNSKLCRGRKFGIGSAEEFPRITGITKLNSQPPVWFVNIGDIRIESTTEQLQMYYKLHQLVMERGNICFRAMKQADWLTLLGDAMKQEVTVIDVPEEVSIIGHFKEILFDYLTDRAQGDDKEDLQRGIPWKNDEDGKIYFQLKSLQEHLKKNGFDNFTRGKIVTQIRDLGGDKSGLNLKKRYMNVWYLPLKNLPQPPELPTPKLPNTPV